MLSGWCLNDRNYVSTRFIGGVQRIFCKYVTENRKVILKYHDLDTFCRISVWLLLGICKVFCRVPKS